jgi:hypothetical protein
MEEKKSIVAVLVLNWNGKRYLSECFTSLQNQTCRDFETYLVDNNSQDDSVSFMQENFPWVKIIRLRENMEFARSYNIAAGIVEEEYLLFLNNDIYVKEDCIERLIERRKKADILGCKLLFYDRRNVIQHAGIQILPLGGGYEIGHGENDDGRFDGEKYVGGVCGAAMFICRNLFLQLLFDQEFEAYFEDVDLCWRALLKGKTILYVPQAVVYHKFGGSYEHDSARTMFLSQRNRLETMMKNFSTFSLIKALLLSVVWDGKRIIRFCIDRKIDIAFSLIKSYFYIIMNIHHILEKRKKVQEERMISDKELYVRGYIASFSEVKRESERSKRIKESIAH